MNFIPEFYQVLAQHPYETQLPKDDKSEDIWDEIIQSTKVKVNKKDKKSCWIYFDDWNRKQIPIMVLIGNKVKYMLPKNTSFYPDYKGPLVEIQSSSFDYIKPSTLVRSSGENKKAKDLKPKSSLDRRHGEQIIQKIDTIKWEGNMFSLSFPVDVLLPVRFDSEYILIPCGVY